MAEVDDLARALVSAGMPTRMATDVATRLTTAYTAGASTVTLTGTQTLTNKTLTSPTLNTTITTGDAAVIVAGTTTGLKIGTATTQKLGFFNSTPVVKPAALTVADATAVGAVYTAAEQTVIINLRTRLGELEARLQSLGLVT